MCGIFTGLLHLPCLELEKLNGQNLNLFSTTLLTNIYVPNKIYNKCSHSDILKPRVWLTKGILEFIIVNFCMINRK